MKTRTLIIIGMLAVLGIMAIILTLSDIPNTVSERLEQILIHCAPQKNSGADVSFNFLFYHNGTHYIDNNTCEWKVIGVFLGD